MPPVFGPCVAVEDPLEVLRRLERVDGRAVGDREQRHLGAVEELLDHHPVALRGVGGGRVAVVGHDDALAGGEAVVLDDVRRAERVERGGRPRRRWCTRGPAAVGTPAAAITSLANALEPSSSAARREGPKQLIPRSRTASATPATSGASGPMTTRSAPRETARAATAAPSIWSTSCSVAQLADPRVAGRGVHLADGGIAGEGQRESVLAPTGADDEGLHVRRSYRRDAPRRPARRRSAQATGGRTRAS